MVFIFCSVKSILTGLLQLKEATEKNLCLSKNNFVLGPYSPLVQAASINCCILGIDGTFSPTGMSKRTHRKTV